MVAEPLVRAEPHLAEHPRPSAERLYIPALDGVRFLAFFLVFFHHFPPGDVFRVWSRGLSVVIQRISQFGWIGVDVGTRAVKLAQVERAGGGWRLRRAAIIQRPGAWTNDDQLALEQPESSRLEIAAARQCDQFLGRNAVCLLSMNVCQLRGLSVPPGEDRERRAIIEDELAAEWEEQRVAMHFEFWELDANPPDKGQEQHNVNILAVTRPWLAQVASDCRRAGLDCWGVDGVPLAMARAVTMTGELGGGRRALAVDWGYSNSTLCVVGDGRALYTRRANGCESAFCLAGNDGIGCAHGGGDAQAGDLVAGGTEVGFPVIRVAGSAPGDLADELDVLGRMNELEHLITCRHGWIKKQKVRAARIKPEVQVQRKQIRYRPRAQAHVHLFRRFRAPLLGHFRPHHPGLAQGRVHRADPIRPLRVSARAVHQLRRNPVLHELC